MKLLFYAGAGLSQQMWNDMAELSLETCGERVLMLTGLGSTETLLYALFGLKSSDRPGPCGRTLTGSGAETGPRRGGKLEARLRGPNVTPGYWRRWISTKAAFDEEGFYMLGIPFVSPTNPTLRRDSSSTAAFHSLLTQEGDSRRNPLTDA